MNGYGALSRVVLCNIFNIQQYSIFSLTPAMMEQKAYICFESIISCPKLIKAADPRQKY